MQVRWKALGNVSSQVDGSVQLALILVRNVVSMLNCQLSSPSLPTLDSLDAEPPKTKNPKLAERQTTRKPQSLNLGSLEV